MVSSMLSKLLRSSLFIITLFTFLDVPILFMFQTSPVIYRPTNVIHFRHYKTSLQSPFRFVISSDGRASRNGERSEKGRQDFEALVFGTLAEVASIVYQTCRRLEAF